MKKWLVWCISLCFLQVVYAQRGRQHGHKDSIDLTFNGTKINPYQQEFDSTGKWQVSGYVDAYYSHYSDTSNGNGFQKFPTISPRNQQFGLNIIQLSAKYNSAKFRSTITLFGGDCPKSAWSSDYNYIQEANLSFNLYKKLWLDMGFFRTHIGLESIQARENITMSLATTTYFEPYYLSGAKLTWQQSDRLTLQLNVFNSFNQFVETNKNKAFGFSMSYAPTKKLNISYSNIVCDESNATAPIHQTRFYNNFCMTFKSTKWVLGLEANYGLQAHSSLSDPSQMAMMFSSIVAVKYRFTPQLASYVRGELFHDPNEILTGPVLNENHAIVGLEIVGMTAGIEFKPIPNSFVRIECRALSNYNQHIFQYQQAPSKIRSEINFGMGVWF
jgi:hypothetical protein